VDDDDVELMRRELANQLSLNWSVCSCQQQNMVTAPTASPVSSSYNLSPVYCLFFKICVCEPCSLAIGINSLM
jgi:hypothetical protein